MFTKILSCQNKKEREEEIGVIIILPLFVECNMFSLETLLIIFFEGL